MLKKEFIHQRKEKKIEQIKTSTLKMEQYKVFVLLKDSVESNFVTKKLIKEMIYQMVNILLKIYKV